MRRSLEILGVTAGLYLHAETDERANRVVQANYPDQVSLGDVTKITERQIAAIVRQHPKISHVLHGTGPPCQQVTGLNAGGAGVTGDRSGLVLALPGLREMLVRAFPDCEYEDMCEMVASLSAEDQEVEAGIGFCNLPNVCACAEAEEAAVQASWNPSAQKARAQEV